MFTDKPQLKVNIEDGCEVSHKTLVYIYTIFNKALTENV